MKTKVTLSMDKEFVEEAKKFAKSKNKSLSAQIEDSLTNDMEEEKSIKKKIAALKSLSGSIQLLPEDANKSFEQLKYEAYKEKFDLP